MRILSVLSAPERTNRNWTEHGFSRLTTISDAGSTPAASTIIFQQCTDDLEESHDGAAKTNAERVRKNSRFAVCLLAPLSPYIRENLAYKRYKCPKWTQGTTDTGIHPPQREDAGVGKERRISFEF